MSKTQKREEREQIAERTKYGLFGSGVFLIVALLFLAFGVGDAFLPVWIIDHRSQIIGVIALLIFVLIISAPIVVEVNSDPRPLSGPGKDPRSGWKP